MERDEQIMNDNKIEERREREGKPEQQVKAKWNNKIMTCAGLTGSGRGVILRNSRATVYACTIEMCADRFDCVLAFCVRERELLKNT